MGDTPRILELRRRIQADPASIAFAQLAEECRRLGSNEEAAEICRAGLVRHPGYLSARVTLGRALIDLGQLDAAKTELEIVVAGVPDNLAAIRGLAEILQRRGQMKEALEYYKRALDLAKHDPDLEDTVERITQEVAPPPAPQPAAAPVSIEEIFNFDKLIDQLGLPPDPPPASAFAAEGGYGATSEAVPSLEELFPEPIAESVPENPEASPDELFAEEAEQADLVEQAAPIEQTGPIEEPAPFEDFFALEPPAIEDDTETSAYAADTVASEGVVEAMLEQPAPIEQTDPIEPAAPFEDFFAVEPPASEEDTEMPVSLVSEPLVALEQEALEQTFVEEPAEAEKDPLEDFAAEIPPEPLDDTDSLAVMERQLRELEQQRAVDERRARIDLVERRRGAMVVALETWLSAIVADRERSAIGSDREQPGA